MMNKHTDPWTFYTWDSFITFDEQKYLYDRCVDKLDKEKFESDELFYLNGELQNNAGVHSICHEHALDQKIYSQLYEMSDKLGYADKGKWSCAYNITKNFPQKQLYPHNDDYEKLGQYGAGMLKVLLYLGNGTDDYTDWGTKLYTEEYNIDSFEKEIEFNPGTCFLFEANKYSYHGTQFDNGINGYRFCLMGEYVDK